MHHEGIHVAESRMQKCCRKASDNVKTEMLPELDGPVIRADHEVELHCPEAKRSGVIQRVSAHHSRDPMAGSPSGRDIAAVGNMSTSTFLIRPEEVGAHNLAVFFREEDCVVRRHPVCESLLSRPIARQRVRFTGTDNWLQDAPDCVGIVRAYRTNKDHVVSVWEAA